MPRRMRGPRPGPTRLAVVANRDNDPRMQQAACSHLAAVTGIKAAERYECSECVKIGSGWVHLRTCQTCGLTHCCDQSPNRHSRKHAGATGHAVVASAEPGERWLYCFTDDEFHDY
jgi:hypothetical protein